MRHTSLIYHDVIDPGVSLSGFAGGDAEIYKLGGALFRSHLDAIGKLGGPPPTIVRGVDDLTGSGTLRTLTFDDGGASALAVIAPSLEALGWRGHFFVPTSLIGTPGFLNAGEIRELVARGHLVGSHSHTHPIPISKLSDEALLQEWTVSRARLESLLGVQCVVASVPGGFLTTRVAGAAEQAGFELLFTSEPRSDVWRVGRCALLGRYSVQQATSASVAAALLGGARGPALRQRVQWSLKHAVKRLFGERWLAVRRSLLAHHASGQR